MPSSLCDGSKKLVLWGAGYPPHATLVALKSDDLIKWKSLRGLWGRPQGIIPNCERNLSPKADVSFWFFDNARSEGVTDHVRRGVG
jgi:hypothetical protein